MSQSQKSRIAFLGLGIMGQGMAARLLAAGFDLTLYNRNPDKASALVAKGAKFAKTPREASKGADVLIAMLADDVASREVWLGEQGALSGASPHAICIECSTLTVPWVRELASDCEKKGLKFLDAPVTGTKPHAAAGELVFLVGGSPDTLEAARPVLVPMSKEIAHLGPAGAGAALKLINNFVCGVQAAALGEALALLQHAGIDIPKATTILANGSAGSPLVKLLTARHTAQDPTINFQLRLMAKDLTYALAEAHTHHMPLPTAIAALQTFTAAIAAGYGDQDLSTIIKFHQQDQQRS